MLLSKLRLVTPAGISFSPFRCYKDLLLLLQLLRLLPKFVLDLKLQGCTAADVSQFLMDIHYPVINISEYMLRSQLGHERLTPWTASGCNN